MMLVFLTVALVLIVSVGPNTITLNNNIPFKSKMNALVPQGWAFFTKDVHKDYFNIYSLEGKKIIPIQLKSSQLSQCLGIIRDNRIINHKIGSILKNIDIGLRYKFKGNINKMPLNILSKVSVKVKEPMVYGTFLIEEGEPLPYDWYKSDLKINTTMNYILLEIKR